MAVYTYKIPLAPIPWQRAHPNYVLRRTFDPQRNSKLAYGIYLESQLDHQPLSGPVRMDADFFFQVAPSRIKKARIERWYWHFFKPDKSNCEKFLEDVAVQVHILSDDCILCDGRIRKMWTFDEPYVLAVFTELNHDMRD